MQLSLSLSTIVASFLLAATGAHASPAPAGHAPLTVWAPTITYPTEGVVLTANTPVNITWDTSNAPKTISNSAMVLLGRSGTDYPFILAKDFDLRSGSVEVTVPYVFSRDGYTFILFGDSGNASPTFTIESDTSG
ncbi:hypothetical protein C8F01DRAFT_1179877 [Mycena amicta]|nr:hypothetical protein C8F01DRAFT_1186330 [Mycena amicta]KAJ7050095.1 hypothetical protein C8F01DRAFT_1179877 [Mycena amicta]